MPLGLLARAETGLGPAARLAHGDLAIEVRVENPGALDWLRRYCHPFFIGSGHAGRAWRVDMIHSDETVTALVARGGEPAPFSEGRLACRSALEGGGHAVVDAWDGSAAIVEPAERRIRLVWSSRTPRPMLLLSDVVSEILIRSLEAEGWCAYHCGAVATEAGVIVVMGDGGDGKTTLIAELARSGAAFVANERCFLRATGDRIEAMAFPQTVAVGIGTALQFPALAAQLPDPRDMAYPRRRLDRARVTRTALEERAALPDKLSLLPVEFAALVGGPPPVPGGAVIGIVRPRVKREAPGAVALAMARPALRDLVARNTLERGRDHHFPDWLDLGLAAAAPQVDALSRLPAAALSFCVTPEGLRGVRSPIAFLHRLMVATGRTG